VHDSAAEHVGHVEDVADVGVVEADRLQVVSLELVHGQGDDLVEVDGHHRFHRAQ
jgi:hypothetical protein